MTNAEAAAILDKLRALLAVDDDGPEGERGPRWVVGQIRELLAEPYGLHVWVPWFERKGWGICTRCLQVRNYDQEVIRCRGGQPGVELAARKAGG